MDLVGPSPSPMLLSSEKIPMPLPHDQTLLVKDEYSNEMMSMSYKVVSNDVSKVNENDAINDKKSSKQLNRQRKKYRFVSYGPIAVRVNLYEVPTLKTGRRSKFLPLEGEEAIKREIRRRKNRETVQRLKEKRKKVEDQLDTELHQLEFDEKYLEQNIEHLKIYKRFLETRNEQTTETILSRLAQQQANISADYELKQRAIKSPSSSPPWQLSFAIN